MDLCVLPGIIPIEHDTVAALLVLHPNALVVFRVPLQPDDLERAQFREVVTLGSAPVVVDQSQAAGCNAILIAAFGFGGQVLVEGQVGMVHREGKRLKGRRGHFAEAD